MSRRSPCPVTHHSAQGFQRYAGVWNLDPSQIHINDWMTRWTLSPHGVGLLDRVKWFDSLSSVPSEQVFTCQKSSSRLMYWNLRSGFPVTHPLFRLSGFPFKVLSDSSGGILTVMDMYNYLIASCLYFSLFLTTTDLGSVRECNPMLLCLVWHHWLQQSLS